ncbi:mechanosensitive ion channel family protein [Acidithiobacillus sp.]|uniref:mechanosensitive ion channel family protein n=1 Tax=Acidithiobacillus sp. TaxID=1872118 RepID=UPI0025BDF782|nr:mechanosensitive ion channel family protein [Acidithiobacillus sp.]
MVQAPNPGRHIFTKVLWQMLLGLILVVAAGLAINFSLKHYFPQYMGYAPLVREIVWSLIVFIIGLWIASHLVAYAERRFARTRKDLYGLTLLIRIAVYVVLLAVILSIFHISIAGILAGSAVGGVVLGFAIHTFASNLLTGIFATASGALNYGDVVYVNSWVWNINSVGQIVEIKALFSKMLTQDGALISIPNSVLLGSSALVEYAHEDDSYIYPVETMVNADVPMELVISEAKKTPLFQHSDIFIQSRNGFNNTLHLLLRFRTVAELNAVIDEANRIIDAAYWKAKNGVTLYGPSYFARASGRYPVLLGLPIDVPSARILSEARAQGLAVNLVNKTNAMNTFLLSVAVDERKDLAQSIEAANLALEGIYEKIKDAAAATAENRQ